MEFDVNIVNTPECQEFNFYNMIGSITVEDFLLDGQDHSYIQLKPQYQVFVNDQPYESNT